MIERKLRTLALGLATIAALPAQAGKESAAARQARFQQAEAKASPEIKKELAAMRAASQGEQRLFAVGATPVTGVDVDLLAGEAESMLSPEEVAARNANCEKAQKAEAARLAKAGAEGLTAAQSLSGVNLNKLPKRFDWRDKGVMSEVRNQGYCGSCTTFAVVAMLEASYRIKYAAWDDLFLKQLEKKKKSGSPYAVLLAAMEARKKFKAIDGSEQEVISCQNPDRPACKARNGYDILAWLSDNGGLLRNKDFPYKAKDVACKHMPKPAAESIDLDNPKVPQSEPLLRVQCFGYVNNDAAPDEASIKKALIEHGPVVVGTDSMPSLHNYAGGIFNDDSSRYKKVGRHAVLIVGWDDEPDVPPAMSFNAFSIPFTPDQWKKVRSKVWIVRNSWGEDWGEEGYYRVPIVNKVNMGNTPQKAVWAEAVAP